jgi:hypothetical protein
MNPALMKLIAQMKGAGAGAMNMAGAKGGQLARMAARNPKTAAAIGAGGAGAAGLGAGMAMGDDEESMGEEELEALMAALQQAKKSGGAMLGRGRQMLGM